MMFRQTILLVLITFIPALELRASIPYGILGNERLGITPGLMPWPLIVAICILANIVLGMIVFEVLSPMFVWLNRIGWFARVVTPVLERTRRRIHPYVEKYGEIGVAIFIGIPLPGSGVYTGALGAFLLGLDRRKFAVANVVGVLIAGAIVTTVTLLIRLGIRLPWMLEHVIKTTG